MVKKTQARGKLSRQQESKVIELARQFLSEQNAENSVFSAHDMTNMDLFRYVQRVGGAVGRLGKLELGKHVDSAICMLRDELENTVGLDSDQADSEMLDTPIESFSEVESPAEVPIFGKVDSQIPSDTPCNTQTTQIESPPHIELNSMNKSVVGLWNVESDSKPESKPDENEKKRRREKSRDKQSKKQKGKFFPIIKLLNQKLTSVDYKPELSINLEDLGGVESIIDHISKSVLIPLIHPEVYRTTGISMPRGILLHGPPGCGKTVLANAIANKAGVPFLSVSAPSVVSGMSGESEKKVREIFEEARSLAPCLLFIDEIDAVTPKREGGARGMETRIVAQLLTCMDDLNPEKNDFRPVIVLGATNRPDAIDAALRRPGRFDEEISMSVPDRRGRKLILQALTKKLKISSTIDFDILAMKTPGYVAADLKALVTSAGTLAMERTFSKLLASNEEVLPTTQEDLDGSCENVEAHKQVIIPESIVPENSSTWVDFIRKFPHPLTASQLGSLCITYDDFAKAIPQIQPSSKREGFATVPDVSWDDIGALAQVRQELHMAIVQPIRQPEIFKAVGVETPGGVLLWGPPGCGKTLLAKAVASETAANFISVRGPELLNKYVGESERAIRQVFERAALSSPCIIFFDEFDSLAPKRDDGSSEHSSRLVNTLLTELNGLHDRKGVYVIAATNRPDIIDPAMVRPGRLDKTLFVGLPDGNERYEILLKACKRRPLADDVSLREIAKDSRCTNFSGADLTQLVNEAGLSALREYVFTNGAELAFEDRRIAPKTISISKLHFETAFGKTKPSVTANDRERYEQLREMWE